MIINLAQKQPRSQAPPLHFSHRQREVVEKERGWLGNLALKHISKIKTKVSKSAHFRIKTNQSTNGKVSCEIRNTSLFNVIGLFEKRRRSVSYPFFSGNFLTGLTLFKVARLE